jgi:L-amino acid N-acyltransferase YncA
VRIESMTDVHTAAVLAIYQAGIDEGNATFETRAPGWAAFTAARLPGHQFVAIAAGQVTGWVAASAVSGRCVYARVVEHSVYVRPVARGQGVGRRLLEALIASTETAGIWTIQVSSRRTPPAWPCTGPPGSASWAPGNARPAPRPMARRRAHRAPQLVV